MTILYITFYRSENEMIMKPPYVKSFLKIKDTTIQADGKNEDACLVGYSKRYYDSHSLSCLFRNDKVRQKV